MKKLSNYINESLFDQNRVDKLTDSLSQLINWPNLKDLYLIQIVKSIKDYPKIINMVNDAQNKTALEHFDVKEFYHNNNYPEGNIFRYILDFICGLDWKILVDENAETKINEKFHKWLGNDKLFFYVSQHAYLKFFYMSLMYKPRTKEVELCQININYKDEI
jgi:hypothetical protein